MIYNVRVFTGIYGLDANNQVTNDYLMRSTAQPGAASFDALTTALVNAHKTILIAPATIVRVLYTPLNPNAPHNSMKGKQMVRFANVAGTRTTATSANIGLTEVVALYGKSTTYGYAGVQKYRGAVFSDEWTSAPNGSLVSKSPFVVTPFNAFGAALMAAFTTNGGTLVLPPAKGDTWDTGHRPVTSMTYQGLGLLQETKNTITTEEDRKEYIQRVLNDIASAYRAAEYDDDGNPVAVGQYILNVLVGQLAQLILQFGKEIVLKRHLPAPIKILLPLLP